MLPCLRVRLRSCILSLVALAAFSFPCAGADAAPDEARWKDEELLAPLPSDPAARDAAIERAIALGAARVPPASARSAAYASSTARPPVGYPARSGTPVRGRKAAAPDPARAAWLGALQSRLRQSEQALSNGTAPATAVASGFATPAVGLTPTASALATMTTFDGIDDTGWDPASPDIAVGPDHILLATTDRFSIMDKCGQLIVEDLFHDLFGLPASQTYYTPKVVYDPWFPHYVMIYIGTETNLSNSVLYIAHSLTADPLGSWSVHALETSVAFPGLKDAPSVAVTPGGIYITYNQFNLSTFAYEQVVLLELIKSDVYGNAALSYFSHQGMTNPNDASLAISMQPAQMRTYGGAMYFVNSAPFGASFMTLWRLTGSPGASILTGFDVSVNPYTTPADMVQPDLSLVEAGDCRIRDAVYAYGKLHAAYTRDNGVASPTVENRRIDVTTLVTDGFFMASSDDFAYPAIDVDENDQVTFAYCTTGAARFLGVGYSTVAFPLNTVASGTVATGLANFSSGGSPARWGHYIGAALDPSDNRTVWIQGCYASNNPLNSWTTRVGAVTAFPPSIFVANTMSTTSVAGFEGGPFAPGQIDFKLDNTGGTTLRWRATGVPSWLTPEGLSGSLDPGASEIVSFFVDADANALSTGSHGATIRFTNCLGGQFYDFPVYLFIGIDGSCPGARLTLAPPTSPTGLVFIPFAEPGTFVTAIEDVSLCAIGIEADVVLPQDITATVYMADGTVRLAPIASATIAAVQDANTVHFIPIDVALQACQEYDIAITFSSGAVWPYWDDTLPNVLPGDVGGLVRVRDAEMAGSAASTNLPRIILIAEGDACTNSTDLDPGVGPGFETTANTSQGLFVQPERTLRLCSVGLQADLTPGTNLTARVYSVFGSTRTALLAEGTTIVISPLSAFHDVPISQVLLAGSQYDLEIEFEGTGLWWSYSIPPATIPYSVDNTMLVYGAEASGVVTGVLPRMRVGWSDPTAGTPFDLAKPGVYPPPFSSSGSLTHGAYITALADEEVYGLGVRADIPKGGYVTAYLYEATGTMRGPLLASGVVVSDGAGMQWHDVPVSASLTTGQYDIMFSAPTVTAWPYWQDSPGLPYDAYGVIRVRDAEAGGVVGTSFLAHMRVHACNPVLTAVGDGPQRAPMLLEAPAPNPATGMVRFGYSIDEAGDVDIAVYDVLGARVADVARARHAGVGRDAVEFDARKLPSGVYFVKLTTRTKSTSRKFVVMH